MISVVGIDYDDDEHTLGVNVTFFSDLAGDQSNQFADLDSRSDDMRHQKGYIVWSGGKRKAKKEKKRNK